MKNSRISGTLILCLIVLFGAAAPAVESQNLILNDAAHGPIAKSKALELLKKTRESQKDQLTKFDQDIKAKIAETQAMQINSSSTAQERAFENKLLSYGESLRALSAKRSELLLKQKFIDQLMFQIDSKWNGTALRPFLEHALLDMALSEMTDPAPNFNQAIFDSYVSIGIREIPEPTEDLISFTIAYLNFSGVSKPKSPLAFMNVRSYSNGTKSVSAKLSKAEGINKLIEHRLKVIEELKTPEKEQNKNEDERTEEFDESKTVHPKPSGMIINFAPNKVSEVMFKQN